MAALAAPLFAQTRTWPDSTSRILVFNDQLDTDGMSEAQFQFSAQYYVGCQKILRDAVRRLRAYNSGFLVLHYRLGQGLGFRIPSACSPTGPFIQIIDTNSWVQEWPGASVVQDAWFFVRSGSRVFNCDWGYYLMDISNSGWRTWWSGQVIAQMTNNEDDGLFADSYSIPNYLGSTGWDPNLPDIDSTFEADWAGREHAFTDYIQGRFAGVYKWIPNLGSLVTSRDPSDWSNVDGAMIEGFAEWGSGSFFDVGDWELQMDRALGLINADKIVIAQNYPDAADIQERMFVLGSYLLVKGSHTYINMDIDMMPEWFPEYAVDLGAPLGTASNISGLYDAAKGVYVRDFEKGHVFVNPGTTAKTFALDATHNLVAPSGGGLVPDSGVAPGSLSLSERTSVTLPAHGAAVVYDISAGCTLTCNSTVPAAGKVGIPVNFAATASATGCEGSPVFSWTFGDGGTGSGDAVSHAYASAGTYGWTLTVTAGTGSCSRSGSVTVASTAPLITSMKKASGPFRFIVQGSRFQAGIRAAINGTPWTNVTRSSATRLVINGGAVLKAAVPRDTPTEFTFTNPDGSSTTRTWAWH